MKWTYIKKYIWHLWGRKQIKKEGFLPPIAEQITRSMLASIAGSLGTKLFGSVAKQM